MAKSQFRSVRKVSGRKYISFRKKRLSDLGRNPALTQIGKTRLKNKRGMGGNKKFQLLSDSKVHITDNGKTKAYEIMAVEKNPANVNYSRRNIITKGCIVKTEKGNVRITSRPGQTGNLFGVLIDKK